MRNAECGMMDENLAVFVDLILNLIQRDKYLITNVVVAVGLAME